MRTDTEARQVVQDLRAARREKGWSQRELSARLRMTQAHLSRIERGLVDPKLSTIVEVARMLEFDLVAVPRGHLNLVRAIMRPADEDRRPAYALDDDE